MRVLVLSSGSSGNALLVESGGTRILVDAGVGPRVAAVRMRALGADLFPRGVDGIVVTHQHGDHIAHAEPLARALRVPLYLHGGISAARLRTHCRVVPYAAEVPFKIGSIEVVAHAVPHDASQVALVFAALAASGRGLRFGLATDLGRVPRALPQRLAECDGALVEANYCPAMLATGPYPQRLRQRISGGLGHLSNEETAALAHELSGSRLARLHLGHLSLRNNTPARALEVVRARASGLPVQVVPHGVPRVIEVLPGARPSRSFVQLGLAFAASG